MTAATAAPSGAAAAGSEPGPLLERVDPGVKLVVLTVLSLSLLVVFDPWAPAVLYGLAVAGAVLGAGIGLRTLVVGQVPFALFAAGTFTVNALTRGGTVVAAAGPLEVTDAGLRVGAALALRTLVIGVCVLAFLRSTDPARLLVSLRLRLHVPARVSFALLAGYRVLDELPEQWETLRRSHAVRRPDPRTAGTGRLPLPPGLALRATTTLLVVALRRGARLAMTMETRGLGSGRRTTWHDPPLTRLDGAFAATCLGALVAVLAAAALTGRLAGPASLLT